MLSAPANPSPSPSLSPAAHPARVSPPEPDGRLRIGVIGAGLAGLACARALADRGHAVVVVDKGRGPGGRCSARRAAPFAFDHGAQYFTARDPRFRARTATWLRSGVVRRWHGRIAVLRDGSARPVESDTARFVGVPAMSALGKDLARGLDVRSGVRVVGVERTGGWSLATSDGGSLEGLDRLVVTAPPAQAAALLGDLSPLGARAADVRMRPSWAVLLGLAGALDVAFDGAFCERSALAWVARDSSKPGRGDAEAWVLHAAPDWSEAHLDEPGERVVERLAAELERVAGAALPEALHRDAHLWRFALPEPGLDAGCLVDRERGLVVAGDALHGGRVEGAYLSGLAAARQLGADPA